MLINQIRYLFPDYMFLLDNWKSILMTKAMLVILSHIINTSFARQILMAALIWMWIMAVKICRMIYYLY